MCIYVHVKYQDVLIEQSPQVRLDQGLNNVMCMPLSMFENLNLPGPLLDYFLENDPSWNII